MTNPNSITCRELIDFLADYLDGTLSPQSSLEFDRHLSLCPSCVAYLDSYRKTIALGRAAMLPTQEPALIPPGLVEAILKARTKVS